MSLIGTSSYFQEQIQKLYLQAYNVLLQRPSPLTLCDISIRLSLTYLLIYLPINVEFPICNGLLDEQNIDFKDLQESLLFSQGDRLSNTSF